jgi:phosphoribosylanthranilate isomerase
VSTDSHLFVKICGLRNADAARVAAEAGADALGFILAPSRRQVTAQEIAKVRSRLSLAMDTVPAMVGVTVNSSPVDIMGHVEASGIDMIQLSGDEDPSILADIDVPVIKMLRIGDGASIDDALRATDAWLSAPKPAVRVFVEGHAEGSYGGTGTRADWGLVARIAEQYPIVLAGGLTPDNVSGAIRGTRPAGVDVSSGIETDGTKDASKIREFIRRARNTMWD